MRFYIPEEKFKNISFYVTFLSTGIRCKYLVWRKVLF